MKLCTLISSNAIYFNHCLPVMFDEDQLLIFRTLFKTFIPEHSPIPLVL